MIKYGNKMLSFKNIKGQSYQLKYDVAKGLMKKNESIVFSECTENEIPAKL